MMNRIRQAWQIFLAARKKRRHDRIMSNINICLAPRSRAQAASLLPKMAWRLVAPFFSMQARISVAVGLIVIIMWPELIGSLGISGP